MKKQNRVLVNLWTDENQLETNCLGLWQMPDAAKQDIEFALKYAWDQHVKTNGTESFASFLKANGWIQIRMSFTIVDVYVPNAQAFYNQQHFGE